MGLQPIEDIIIKESRTKNLNIKYQLLMNLGEKVWQIVDKWAFFKFS